MRFLDSWRRTFITKQSTEADKGRVPEESEIDR